MRKTILSILIIATIAMSAKAQVVPCQITIPDANFKAYLVGNTAINTNGDTEIQCTEASTFTGAIDCSFLSITDMTGIEEFVALTELQCQFNSLTSLDVSNNTALITLWFYSNSITTIDLSNNINLEFLSCWGNILTSLDISSNTALTRVYCANNALTYLNVANGNNINFTYAQLQASNNPSLTCIQVDDVTYSTANWTDIDATASFSTNCGGAVFVSSINIQGQSGRSTITTQDGTLQMEATVLPSNADDMTYTWSVMNGSGSASIDANGLLTAITDGTVTVIATANDASGVTETVTITISNQDVSLGLDELNSQSIPIYPNPVSSQLYIDTEERKINQLEVIDYTGNIIQTITDKQINSIDVSNLTQGIYILKISTENGILVHKVLKK